ncbi:MAG: hypothetical protein K2K74_09700, partial [Lachnospiraceae bacterium]|nr:hypothetical protein [Lachnospiraceae bacterium]
VFYYTEQELKFFKKWHEDLKISGDDDLENILNVVRDLDEEADHVKFFIRLLIKVPFLNPVFPKAVMKDFDKMVERKISTSRTKQKESLLNINDIFMKAITDNEDMEKVSEVIYQKFMEET